MDDGDEAGPAVAQTLHHWLTERDLAGARDKDALEKLPEAEPAQWQKLWEEVEQLRQGAAGKP